jgi:exopolyphosphatase/guanosine-5'-triphosphate,3'-diphosphate pyrophosphatase
MEEEFSVKARLGEGFSGEAFLSEQAITRVIAALKEFREVTHLRMIRNILTIATSAVREATNQQEFLRLVQKETGFKFKVLSEMEEALYSYMGASKAICLPEALFFDLGGGSLEIVSTKDYRVKKIMSLPLGALRLSEKFVPKSDRVFSKKDVSMLEKEITDTLPTSSDLKISKEIPLIGIGGSVRTIARYHQKITKYPLTKLHNYSVDLFSLQLIRKNLCKLRYNEIADIDVIGNKRAYSITAASFVIEKLMQRLEIENMVVSTHGLREGYLSEYLRNPMDIYSRRLDTKNIHNHTRDQRNMWVLSNMAGQFMRVLLNSDIITRKEYQIFVLAKRILSDPFVIHIHKDVLFELVMSEICPMLTHEDQLILALSLVYRRKPKNAENLYSTYNSLFVCHSRKSVQKIALCIDLSEILERYEARVQLRYVEPKKFTLKIIPSISPFPELIIKNKIKAFEGATDIELGCLITDIQERPRETVSKSLIYNPFN